jgi:hypothetical protein
VAQLQRIRTKWATISVVVLTVVGSIHLMLTPTGASALAPYRAFQATSYWNTSLPADAPLDPNSANIINWIQSDSSTNYVHLSGTDSTGKWGQPIYWARVGDPVYAVHQTQWPLPPEFSTLRIPANARPDPTSDASMTIYDPTAGYVAWLWRAVHDPNADTWSAGGGSVHYLSSNGLDRKWRGVPGTDPRNRGHRGVAGPAFPVRYDEIQAGAISHVLKIAVHTTKCAHVFPMVGDECGSPDQYAPPEGTRVRIDPSIDLTRYRLSPAALVVARALQSYGAVIGDQSGGPVTLKVENTIAEGRGWQWKGLLTATSLSAIPLDAFQVIRLGYAPQPRFSPVPGSSPSRLPGQHRFGALGTPPEGRLEPLG